MTENSRIPEKYYKLFDNLPIVEQEPITNTMVKILGIEGRETYITKWLAFLLDPNNYGNPDILNALLGIYNEKLLNSNTTKHSSVELITDASSVEVTYEFVLNENGRIDLLIESNDFLIGIENKIFATLGNQQLKRYNQALNQLIKEKKESEKQDGVNERDRECVLIFLTPSKHSESESDGFIKITYKELVEKLKELHIDWIKRPRESLYLKDFITYVDEYLEGEEQMESKEWMIYLSEHYEELQTIYEQGGQALSYFVKMLEQRVENLNGDTEINSSGEWSIGNSPKNRKWIQVWYDDWNKYNVHYEFIFDKDTQNFLIPRNLILNLDVENENSKKVLQMKKNTKILKKELKFQAEEEIDIIINEFFEKLKEFHNEHYQEISKNLASIRS